MSNTRRATAAKASPKAITAAEAAATEAGDSQAVGAGNGEVTDPRRIFQFAGLQLVLPRKWKRFKFVRNLKGGDLWGALEAIWQPIPGENGETKPNPVLDQVAELDVDEDEFQLIVERLGETLMGSNAGNSSPSPPS